jgi:hypothetical protein
MFPAKLKWPAKIALYIVAVCAILWGISVYIDYSMSLALVTRGVDPGFAATDAAAFQAVAHPTEVMPGIAELKASGRVIHIAEGTRCRIIYVGVGKPCEGNYYTAMVRLLDGPRKGQDVWMCSDSFDTLYKWP